MLHDTFQILAIISLVIYWFMIIKFKYATLKEGRTVLLVLTLSITCSFAMHYYEEEKLPLEGLKTEGV